MEARSKKNDLSINEETITAVQLRKLLTSKKFLDSPDLLRDADLTYLLEKLGRKLFSDEDIKISAYHFRSLVENLKKHSHISHDQHQELELCLKSGETYAVMGLTEDAEKCYEQAIQLSVELNDAARHARSCRYLGNLKFQQQGKFKEAIKCFEKSLEICQENGELLDEAYGLNSLSATYFQLASWKKMEDVCNQALAICEQLDEDELIACINNNLGAMYSLRGLWQKSLAAFQKSLPLFEKLGDYRGLAETYNNLATLYRDRDMWHEAGRCFALSIRFASQIGDTITKANAILNRAELYVMMHDLELARKNCFSVIGTFHKLGKGIGEADACKLLGVIYTKSERWDLAKKYFDESLEISKKSHYQLGLAETYRKYADFHLAQNRNDLAAESLKRSLKNYRSLKAHGKARQVEKFLNKIQTSL
ncbi:MAG: tetratricopeptide repeat protein [Calditrichaeota bacterium]|nr:MAG: tetratricopeptide repeat protein [Calditrichota bacterium]